jgi:hypothetical protein
MPRDGNTQFGHKTMANVIKRIKILNQCNRAPKPPLDLAPPWNAIFAIGLAWDMFGAICQRGHVCIPKVIFSKSPN